LQCGTHSAGRKLVEARWSPLRGLPDEALAVLAFAFALVQRCDVRDELQLVAEASADGDLVASLGTAAAEYGCARFGLHPGKKPVGLRAMAAVRLEGTLRHLTRLLLNFFAMYNSPSVYLKADAIPKKAVNEGFRSKPKSASNMLRGCARRANCFELHK
jgi:hypothetical protein